MKNTMKISGVAGTIMFGFAAMFKIQHWPGAGVLMTLGALILAFVFLPSALSVLWKETHSTKTTFPVYFSISCRNMLLLQVLFSKFSTGPVAGFILTLGALSGILLFIPALL